MSMSEEIVVTVLDYDKKRIWINTSEPVFRKIQHELSKRRTIYFDGHPFHNVKDILKIDPGTLADGFFAKNWDEVEYDDECGMVRSQVEIPKAIFYGTKTKQRSTGKRLRFTILNRDNFTCTYCGRKPPEVKLCVDHKTPVSQGGTDHPDNLATACYDCNGGKSDKFNTGTQLDQTITDADGELILLWLGSSEHPVVLDIEKKLVYAPILDDHLHFRLYFDMTFDGVEIPVVRFKNRPRSYLELNFYKTHFPKLFVGSEDVPTDYESWAKKHSKSLQKLGVSV